MFDDAGLRMIVERVQGLESASPEELSDVLSRLSEKDRELQDHMRDLEVKLGVAKNDLVTVERELQEKFGVTGVEEMEAKERELWGAVLSAGRALQDAMDGGEDGEG